MKLRRTLADTVAQFPGKQHILAERMGTTRAVVKSIVAGAHKREPVAYLCRMADALGVRLEGLRAQWREARAAYLKRAARAAANAPAPDRR